MSSNISAAECHDILLAVHVADRPVEVSLSSQRRRRERADSSEGKVACGLPL